MTGTGRHRTGRSGSPPDPQRRPVLLHYAATGRPARRGWSERLALVAGAIAVLAAIGTATLTGAWAGFSLLGAPGTPARAAIEEGEDGGTQQDDPAPDAGAAAPQPPAEGPVAVLPERTPADRPQRRPEASGCAPPPSTASMAGRAGAPGAPSRENPAQAPVSVAVPIAASTAMAPATRASRSDHRRGAGLPVAA